jgi:hypothetical protein
MRKTSIYLDDEQVERYETRRLFNFDERHFRAVAPLQGGSFSLPPADF